MANRPARTPGNPLDLIRADLKDGPLGRVYLFYGEEEYLILVYSAAIARKVLAPGAEGLDRTVVDGEGKPSKVDLRRLSSEVGTPPFLSSRKLVLVRNSGLFASDRKGGGKEEPTPDESEEEDDEETSSGKETAKDRTEALVRLIDQVPDSACLVFLEKKVDRRMKKPLEAIERCGRIVEFALQEPGSLRTFVTRELSTSGIAMEAEAVDSLLLRSGNAMQTIVSEVEKLRLYCTGSGTTRVTMALVEEICVPDLTGKVFDMTDALGQGRPGDALSILDTLVSRKEPVQLLLFMLSRHVRQLIRAKETPDRDRLPSVLGVPPFIAGRYADQARNFSMEALEELHTRCFEADASSKTGKMPDRMALEAVLASVPVRGSTPRIDARLRTPL
jgi:DNA polymerase-3 subunit delta